MLSLPAKQLAFAVAILGLMLVSAVSREVSVEGTTAQLEIGPRYLRPFERAFSIYGSDVSDGRSEVRRLGGNADEKSGLVGGVFRTRSLQPTPVSVFPTAGAFISILGVNGSITVDRAGLYELDASLDISGLLIIDGLSIGELDCHTEVAGAEFSVRIVSGSTNWHWQEAIPGGNKTGLKRDCDAMSEGVMTGAKNSLDELAKQVSSENLPIGLVFDALDLINQLEDLPRLQQIRALGDYTLSTDGRAARVRLEPGSYRIGAELVLTGVSSAAGLGFFESCAAAVFAPVQVRTCGVDTSSIAFASRINGLRLRLVEGNAEPIAPTIRSLGCTTSVLLNQSVTCQPDVSGPATKWAWFTAPAGSPSTGGDRNFQTSFSSSGQKVVTLDACNESACNRRSETITIGAPQPPAPSGPDTDGDSIPDSEDRCVYDRGPAVFNGCPDSDADGVPDPDDPCEETPGPITNGGCPIVAPVTVTPTPVTGKYQGLTQTFACPTGSACVWIVKVLHTDAGPDIKDATITLVVSGPGCQGFNDPDVTALMYVNFYAQRLSDGTWTICPSAPYYLRRT